LKRIILKLLAGATLLALGAAPSVCAVVTEKVDHDTFAKFSAGELDNVSLTSEGHLELAPAMTNLASPTDPIIWCAVQDAKGNVFFGTGNQGKVYKLTPKGKFSTFFAPNEVMIHALAIDGKGRLYAATSPNGRVYRLDADGHAEVFCSPGETYIWAMTFGKDGSLFLATGDHGKILRVAPTDSTPAKVETYFETDEANISSLALDRDGNLLAGTSPHGYLYSIDRTHHGFVVFNSGDTEIKQIAVDSKGVVYASTFVEKSGQNSASGPSDPPLSPDGRELATAQNLSGAIYRIETNGGTELYWSAPDEAIYSMILLRDGNLLAGTGDQGRVYFVSSPNHWKLLQQTGDGTQVAALLPDTAESKQYFAATSHPAKLYRLDFSLAESGTYTSKAFDAKQKSLWGRMHPDGDVPGGTKLEFSTRSGNTDKPEKTWSDWSQAKPLSTEIAIDSPSARYLQYRVRFKRDAGSPSATAQLRRVQFYYQNQNVAPVISRIKVYTEGFGVSRMPMPQGETPPVNLDELLDGGDFSANPATMMHPPLKVTKGPGLCTVVWDASDPNQDQLTYSVAIRSESEKQLTMLVDKTEDTFFSFDTTGFREGVYFIKVTASDRLSNTPETAQTTEETSEAFLIDNTPPVLTVKSQRIGKNQADIVVEAVDGVSVISSASYSLDGKDEVALRPDSLIFDSTHETFVIALTELSKGTHSLLLRVQDEAKNTSVLKFNFESQ
jgi:outer membrane protein assembly factor BamB